MWAPADQTQQAQVQLWLELHEGCSGGGSAPQPFSRQVAAPLAFIVPSCDWEQGTGGALCHWDVLSTGVPVSPRLSGCPWLWDTLCAELCEDTEVLGMSQGSGGASPQGSSAPQHLEH